MSLKKRLVDRDILDTNHSPLAIGLDDPVHQQKRIAMRQYLQNPLNVGYRNTVIHVCLGSGTSPHKKRDGKHNAPSLQNFFHRVQGAEPAPAGCF